MSAINSVEEKTVLVLLLDHAKPVTFSGGKTELLCAIRDTYKDVIKEEQQLFLKVSLYSQLAIHIIKF